MPGEPDLTRRYSTHVERRDLGVSLIDGQPGYERISDAGAHEALDDAAVVGSKDDPRFDALAHQVRLSAVRESVGDERKSGDLSDGDALSRLGELGAGGGEEHIGVGQHVDSLDGGLERVGDEGEVELASHEGLDQEPVLGLDEPDLDRRPTLDVEAHHGRNHPHADALERGHAKRSRVAFGECVQVCCGGAHRCGSPRRVAEQSFAGLGRRHGTASSRALQQLQLGRPLEHRDLLADRGLGVSEPTRRGSEGAGLDNRLERGEVPELDSEQSISTISYYVQRLVFYLSIGRADPEWMLLLAVYRHIRADPALSAVSALAFASAVTDAALLPVLPTMQDRFGLSGVQTGGLLSAATIVSLAVSIPIGLLAGRIGSRRLLLASAALLPLSLLVLGLATRLEMLIAARALYGLSFGVLWTVAPAVAAGSGRGASGTGRLIAAAGAGWLIGPVLSGIVTDVWGYKAAFLIIAVLTLPLAVVLAKTRSGKDRAPAARLRDAIAAARNERALGGVMLVSALLGAVAGVSGLLAPLVLAANGLSAGRIGLVIALAAIIFTAAGATCTRLPSARVDVGLVGATAAVLGATFLIPVVSFSTAAVIGFLVFSAGARAVLNTVVYALARSHVPSEALATPIVGVMNVTWAATALAAPLIAGVALSAGGAKWAFVAIATTGFAVAAWMLLPQPRAAHA